MLKAYNNNILKYVIVLLSLLAGLSACAKKQDGKVETATVETAIVETEPAFTGAVSDDLEEDRKKEIAEYYVGTHIRSYDESTLSIIENADGTFKVDVSITRLCSLDDGLGTYDTQQILFTVNDPNGNPMKAIIYRDADNSLTIKITESTWDYLPVGETIEGFGR